MTIDRCICFNTTFEELKNFAQQRHCGLDELRAQFGCGKGCALCVPYIRVMLQTGQTSFSPTDPSFR